MLERHWTMTALNVAPAAARRAVHDFCLYVGLEDDRTRDVILCVSEAVTNVVLDHHDAPDESVVEIDAYVDEHLCVHVRDPAGSFKPRPEVPGGGPWLPMVSQVAHSVQLRNHDRGGTEVVMRFALG